jgi:hypothetical protein
LVHIITQQDVDQSFGRLVFEGALPELTLVWSGFDSLDVSCHPRENSDEVIKDFLGLGVGEFYVATPVSLTGNLQRIGAIPPEEDLGDFSGSLVRAVTLT